jgi:hypothetical protein
LGSPQHLVVGAVLAFVVYWAGGWRRVALPSWAAFVLAVGVVCTAELVLELVEYPVMYADKFHASAYYDTLADMANSVVGALIGATAGALVLRRGRRAV